MFAIRAERKAGELLRDMTKAKRGADERGQGSQRSTPDVRTLADLGVSRDQSSRWQKLAEVPAETIRGGVELFSAKPLPHRPPKIRGRARVHRGGAEVILDGPLAGRDHGHP